MRGRPALAEHYRYSYWDGTQVSFDLDAYRLLDRMSEDLMYHGDVSAALRRLLAEGFDIGDAESRVQGLREVLERIRSRRAELSQAAGELGENFREIADELNDIVRKEREAIDAFAQAARDSGDERRSRTAESTATERRMALDLLPDDLAGKFRSLSAYDFVDPDAAHRFAELSERLRREVADTYFSQVSETMSAMTLEELSRLREAIGALNTMIEQRTAGSELDPSFEEFMSRFGDLFPGDPKDLDELLGQLAQRMAAVSAMLSSMSPEQRAQLQALASQLLSDMDLGWQVDRLAGNLRDLFPDAGWGRRFQMSGTGPLPLGEMASLFEDLGGLDDLEKLITGNMAPGWLAEADMDRVRHLLGEDEARSLQRLAEISRVLEDAGLIEQREGRLELTARGARHIGEDALNELFARLSADRLGAHPRSNPGAGHERELGTKAYEFGDPFTLDIAATLRNAVQRSGGGIPVTLHPDDLEIERTENIVSSSTVLALDLSLSMPMRDNFLPAKKVALALHTLISTRFPHDFLGVVTFSEVAREVKPRDLPSVSWDFVYGTNLAHALSLSRAMLAGRHGNKQIILVTDGEPTAHLDASGEVVFHYPPIPETIERSLAEVVRCTKAGIRINTFALDAEGYLRTFVEKMTQLNRGCAFFTDARNLGSYVLVDFLDSRTPRRSRRSA